MPEIHSFTFISCYTRLGPPEYQEGCLQWGALPGQASLWRCLWGTLGLWEKEVQVNKDKWYCHPHQDVDEWSSPH